MKKRNGNIVKKIFSFFIIIAVLSMGCAKTSLYEQTRINESDINEIETNELKTNELITEDATNQEVSSSIIEVNPEEVPQDAKIPLTQIPAYSGQIYAVIDNNQPEFAADEINNVSFETYSELDSLGRCGVAYANIGTDIMPTEERGEIGMVKPSGWHTVKYDCVDGKYLYNRCHLIAYMLAGENANVKNLITGTRFFNVEGMLPFETQVSDYVKETDNHVLYRVTPIYEGNNLVASGVQMEAYSVEDAGKGICYNVFVYNMQPGVVIDYTTGESRLEDQTTKASNNTVQTDPQKQDNSKSNNDKSNNDKSNNDKSNNAKPDNTDSKKDTNNTTDTNNYILNTNTKKFHYPSCSSVKSMKESNKQSYSGSRDELIKEGYSPCKKCNP